MSRTILLVEDNTDNRIIYRRALEHFGYRVIEALDGEEAIRLATEHVPDLVLMDISIPRINGWEATRAILADERTKGIPVVALTAHAMPADRAASGRGRGRAADVRQGSRVAATKRVRWQRAVH